MSRHIRILLAGIAGVAAFAGLATAQIVVTDPAVTAKNTIVATLKQRVLETVTEQAQRFRRMARRLSVLTNLNKYSLPEPPMWRIHLFEFEQFVYANAYHAALNYGDRHGKAFDEVARTRVAPGEELAGFGEDGIAREAAIVAQLATLDVADSAIIAATDQTGQLRYNGRKEVAAIDALERDVLDPSPNQSATAVLDKLSGGVLIGARQRQARIQFLAGIVEQLLVDNKRARDTEAAIMNMQVERLRYGRAAGPSLVVGAANDLRAWKQP